MGAQGLRKPGRGSRGLRCGRGRTPCAFSVGRLWSAERRPCAPGLLTSVLRAFPPAQPCMRPPLLSRWAPGAPARRAHWLLGFIRLPPARSESGFPFSWTRFLTWALWRGSARRAPRPGSWRRSWRLEPPALHPGTNPQHPHPPEPWPGALSVKSTTSAPVLMIVFFRCYRSRRRRSLQGWEEPGVGAAEPSGAER